MHSKTLDRILLGLACMGMQACTHTEALSDHNLLQGKILTIVHGCGGFETYRNTMPPNTVAAAERSLGEGADAIEMDVQLSADGQLVVFHDGTLDKKTTCMGCIGDQSWPQLQGCRYKTRNHSLDGIYPLPLLDTMLAAAALADDDALIFLNTKHDSPCDAGAAGHPAFCELLVQCIRRHALADRVVIESMDAGFLRTMRATAPDLKLLFDDEDFERGMQVVRTDHLLGLAISNGQVTEAQVRQAHAEGYWLGIWGVKVSNDTRRAVQKGPEFIMTDDLLMLQAALKQ
jgi:glycerophosphoryl diester phosphodiesterase